MRSRVRPILLFTVAATVFSFMPAQARPRLALLVVVDQLSADIFELYGPLFTGGMARLRDEGVCFTAARHDHAMTLTSVGHATLVTGAYPSRHGIVGNHWVERATGQRAYSCEDSTVQVLGDPEAEGRSPQFLMTETLGDWLRQTWPEARVFTVSQKDYSAILLGGRHPNAAYWFDDAKGIFVTSSEYLDSLPPWVRDYDCFPFRERAVREGWTRGWPAATYTVATADDIAAENDGIHTCFPHLYDSAASLARTPSEWMLETPYSDALELDFAKRLVREEGLGSDTIPDLLCLSLSANDYVGHSFGPYSQEALDVLLRVDAGLSEFLGALDSLVGTGMYTVALSSDHGVMPLPEVMRAAGLPAERILRAEARQHLETAARRVADKLGIAAPLITGHTNGLMLNLKAGEEQGVRPADLRQAMAEAIGVLDYVEEVLTWEQLTEPGGAGRGYRALYRQSFHPDRAPDLVIRYRENTLILDSPQGTTHGSPYRYDTHVPLIFWGHGVSTRAKTVANDVRTIDVAPTLAAILELTPPAAIDGVCLRAVIEPHEP
ncbi:MAG TPA: alkaline phosphatase family protein [bacterium]|nr:alkaline phosphatase family protein [bacterium]